MTDGKKLKMHLIKIGMPYSKLAEEIERDRSFVSLLVRRKTFQVKTKHLLCGALKLNENFFEPKGE